MAKTEELEAKIRKVVEVISFLQRENKQLKMECESLNSHILMLTGENNKAQRAIANFDQLRKKHEAVTHRVEKALSSLNALRTA